MMYKKLTFYVVILKTVNEVPFSTFNTNYIDPKNNSQTNSIVSNKYLKSHHYCVLTIIMNSRKLGYFDGNCNLLCR